MAPGCDVLAGQQVGLWASPGQGPLSGEAPTGTGTAMGVTESLFDAVITGALADHCHKTNPRIASADEYRDMLLTSL